MDAVTGHPDLTRTAAHGQLTALAVHPLDLAAPAALTPARMAAYRVGAGGWELLYGTQRVDASALAALEALARETHAVGQFRAMMAGAVLNRIAGFDSENRRVLHTASRNVFDDLPDAQPQPDASDAVQHARDGLARLKAFLDELDGGQLVNGRGEAFTDLVNIGIGGSDLGPRALYLALRPFGPAERRVHFISNVDPDDAAQVLGAVDLSRTLINVVSKSGSTLETLTNEALARDALQRAGLPPARHMLCVTGEGSPMDDPARYLRTFHMYDYIGGRYSATSMVGGVLLGFAYGYNQWLELLRGAREMDLAALEPEPLRNLPLLGALLGVWNRNYLGLPILAVLPYSQGLIRFAAHLQQVDMESNGKRITRQGQPAAHATGPIVWGEPGTNGQHAFYQLIHQSETVVPCEFIGLRQSQYGLDREVEGTTSQQKLLANLLAQSLALATGQRSDNPNKVFPGNRPNSVLIADRLTPQRLGALLAYYEAKVAFQGFLWNINSFDQEGVQLGKVLANRLLAHMQAGPDAAQDDDPLGWAMLREAGVLGD